MRYGLLLLILHMPCVFAHTQDVNVFSSQKEFTRFQRLTYQLRCLVCQNQTLAESNAPLAVDLRHEIATKIRQGQSDQAIVHYLVRRYGDYVLYKPPLKRTTYLLWFGPFILLFLGFLILIAALKRMQKQAAQAE